MHIARACSIATHVDAANRIVCSALFYLSSFYLAVFCLADHFRSCKPENLDASTRLDRVLQKLKVEIEKKQAIICLQEVSMTYAGAPAASRALSAALCNKMARAKQTPVWALCGPGSQVL